MNDDKIKGATRMIGGKLEDVAGGLIGDTGMQARGKIDQLAGTAQHVLGEAKEAIASAAGEAGSTVGGLADRAATAAADLGHDAYATSANLADKVGEELRKNPFIIIIAAGLLGVAAGYLFGRPSHVRTITAGRARASSRD